MTRKTMTVRELTVLLIREAKITSGHWGLNINLDFSTTTTSDGTMTNPAVCITIKSFDLVQGAVPNALSVDASTVYPRTVVDEYPTVLWATDELL
jgi:hypothetical protein